MISILNGPLTNVAVITAFVCSIIFIIGYTKSAPWWRYRVGRAMVSLDAAITITLLPGILRLDFHIDTSDAFFDWYKVLSLFVVAGTTLWRLYTIHRIQATAQPDPPPVPEEKKEEPHDAVCPE